MSLDPEDREYVVSSAVDILRHRQRGRLIRILRERLNRGDYDDDRERELDRIVLSLTQTLDEKLEPTER